MLTNVAQMLHVSATNSNGAFAKQCPGRKERRSSSQHLGTPHRAKPLTSALEFSQALSPPCIFMSGTTQYRLHTRVVLMQEQLFLSEHKLRNSVAAWVTIQQKIHGSLNKWLELKIEPGIP